MTQLDLNTIANFTWDFGGQFYVETHVGGYIWNDPDHGGDNTLRKTDLTYAEWINSQFGRDKGEHIINQYCGSDVVVIEDTQ